MKLEFASLRLVRVILFGLLLFCLPASVLADSNVQPTATATNTPVNTPTNTAAPTATNTPRPTSTALSTPVPSWTPVYPYPDSQSAGADLDFEQPSRPWTAQLTAIDFILMILILMVLVAFGGFFIYWVYFYRPALEDEPPV